MPTGAMSSLGSHDASPVLQLWISATCMAAAGLLAPGALIGIAAFPLYAISIFCGVRGFTGLPASTHRPSIAHLIWFIVGLLGAEFFALVTGSTAFAMTHPALGAAAPSIAVVLLLGLVPVLICIYAAERRTERGWGLAATLFFGFVIANPLTLLIGLMLNLPAQRGW